MILRGQRYDDFFKDVWGRGIGLLFWVKLRIKRCEFDGKCGRRISQRVNFPQKTKLHKNNAYLYTFGIVCARENAITEMIWRELAFRTLQNRHKKNDINDLQMELFNSVKRLKK